jgi:transcriptional regulator GlxA family with amidase domain
VTRRLPQRPKAPRGKPQPQHWEFLVCDDGLEGPGAAIADLLRSINLLASMRGARRDPLAWQWTRADGRATRRLAGHGARVPRPDVLVVPGWHARNGPHLDRLVARDVAACERLRAVHAAGGRLLALFNGVALAGEAGLLEGARAAVPWPFIASVLRHAPTLELAAGEAVVEHDRVWTVDSPTLATQAALALLRAPPLSDLAEAAGAVVLHAPERQRLARAVAADARSRVGPGSLERARRWLEDHLHEPYSLAATARAAATSERSLLRHFKASFGQTPLAMLHAMRVTRARMLLESSYLGVEAIAERCGWHDAATLRDVFRRSTGLTPGAYRERYRLRAARREWGRDLR